MSTAQKPLVHLNGTAKQSLLEGYCDAATKLREALEALKTAAPNARDYYPIGPDAFTDASREQGERYQKIRDVLADMEALAEHVADA